MSDHDTKHICCCVDCGHWTARYFGKEEVMNGAPCHKPDCGGNALPILPEGVAQVLNNMLAGMDFAREAIRRNLARASYKDEPALLNAFHALEAAREGKRSLLLALGREGMSTKDPYHPQLTDADRKAMAGLEGY